MKATITINIQCGASDAAKEDYLNSLIREIEAMRFNSWRQSINTDWDERYPVALDITGKVER